MLAVEPIRKSRSRLWLSMSLQVLVIAGVFAWRFYVRTSAYLNHPTDGDLYAHNWSFQALAFSFYGVPLFLVIVGALLTLEYSISRLISKKKKDRLGMARMPDRSSFREGCKYRVMRSYSYLNHKLILGEFVVFVASAYSPREGVTRYWFKKVDSVESNAWHVFDNQESGFLPTDWFEECNAL
jgi:hypothetical protein